MNSSSIGIEAANLGNGETWPTAQLDAYVRLVGELCRAYDIPVSRVHSHGGPDGWAPDRKVDPAGPPRYASGNDTWDMDAFRRDVTDYLNGDAPPPPEPDEVVTETVTLELPVLRAGDHGPAVSRMQHLLAAAGFMDEGNTSNYDGQWGDGTDAAKQRFDTAHDLLPSPPTDCGPASWRALLEG
jgi:hypothetical protein